MSRPAGSPAPLGPLGRRLLLVVVAVALAAVALVAAAGLLGSALGLSASTAAQRGQVAGRVAQAASDSYSRNGSWAVADLTGAATTAAAGGARVTVLDAAGRQVASTRPGSAPGAGSGPGEGAGRGTGSTVLSRAVVVADVRVGTVVVAFPRSTDAGPRLLAWTWIAAAAAVAVLAAAAVGWFLVRSVTRPLVALIEATRAFGAGDVAARPAVRGIGELGELAQAFDQAAGAVAEHDRLRRQVVADVAHELRTPLTALQLGLEELRDGFTPADARALTRLHDQSLRLARTVEELSALATADAAAADLALRVVDAGALTAEAVSARDAQLRAAGLVLRTDLEPVPGVRLDPDRWHQVVGNLLDNCSRHCRPGDVVTVSTATGAGGGFRLVVTDTGPGIPADDLPHVTERFWRGRDRDAVRGSGIGLAVVARLVEAHGGRLAVRSDGRSGTRVVVELPGDRG